MFLRILFSFNAHIIVAFDFKVIDFIIALSSAVSGSFVQRVENFWRVLSIFIPSQWNLFIGFQEKGIGQWIGRQN